MIFIVILLTCYVFVGRVVLLCVLVRLLLALAELCRFLGGDIGFLDNISVLEPLGGSHAIGLDLASHSSNGNRVELVIFPDLLNGLECGRVVSKCTLKSGSHINHFKGVQVDGLDSSGSDDGTASDRILTHDEYSFVLCCVEASKLGDGNYLPHLLYHIWVQINMDFCCSRDRDFIRPVYGTFR
nr:MAG TPA_asm: hypothetical protein [Caudoviricetes sp.]